MTYVSAEDVGMLVLRLPRYLTADSATVERLKDAVRHTAVGFVTASSGPHDGPREAPHDGPHEGLHGDPRGGSHDGSRSGSPDGPCGGLLPRIRAYIDENLGDPNLSPEAVAAAHHISTSYLYKLFARQGVSVARWIRQRRLERCRKDLSDPRLGGRAVGEVGAQWGFVDSSYFSRVFRQTYGCSPRAYRHGLKAS
ncbi:helix-turn-helix domain-containing protein [Streptosporangium algeriense]|uniref:Helix-turn-helix domain-containing protein n=1 Tax=Streptosporangium algeriense TaxID=1682748 RepID=A0ABW3DM88_9ACTN